MTMTSTIPATRTGDLLLARLLVAGRRAPGPKALREALNTVRRRPLDADGFEALVAELAAAGVVTVKPLTLTDAGRARALEFLGITELPPRSHWGTVRDRYLVPLALGVPPEAAETRKKIAEFNGLSALMLKRRYDLPAGLPLSTSAAVEALACRELGFPNETKLAAVRDRVLARLLGTADRLSADGTTTVKLPALRSAVLSGWADDEVAEPQTAPEPPAAFDLPAFAATVNAAARDCTDGRFGRDAVFIASVWRSLRAEPGVPALSLDEFKARLVEAHRDGLVRLARADLVQAMDPAAVCESETHYLGAVFHFILAGGDRP
jgi:hypothetical protein